MQDLPTLRRHDGTVTERDPEAVVAEPDRRRRIECTSVRSSHVSRSRRNSAPPSTHATVPSPASPPASRVDGHCGTFGLGEGDGSADPRSSRSGRNRAAARPPATTRTTIRTTATTLGVRRPRAYRCRPERGIRSYRRYRAVFRSLGSPDREVRLRGLCQATDGVATGRRMLLAFAADHEPVPVHGDVAEVPEAVRLGRVEPDRVAGLRARTRSKPSWTPSRARDPTRTRGRGGA